MYESLPISDTSFAVGISERETNTIRTPELENEFRAYYEKRQAEKRQRVRSAADIMPD